VSLDNMCCAVVVEDHFGVEQTSLDAQRLKTRGRGVHDASPLADFERGGMKVSGFNRPGGGLGCHAVPCVARTHDQGLDAEFPA